ncbi:hypothetical protein C497_03855 [Halalkalicoccus jeotgali B3]|uniref:Anti-CBASS protein Acb1-like N-terminal domain-containing protein n=2 Tax=Halalkalicoccus jeotgali TaxID=413810 RepID=D8J9W5_HALJB|nr:hypothetical protein HacjB3_05480 [Halalkalicoccus jeotgali B3]ELY40201.1 hypothetical protein C497_03855 [Halalkalicoccus jeotgali B3]
MAQFGIRGALGVGRSHRGRRDYWDVFGYPDPRNQSAEDYELRARVQPEARIITEAPVRATWKRPPIIRDTGRADGDDPTQFEQDVQQLLDGSTEDRDPNAERAGLNTYWSWADRAQRPVQYGLLFTGYRDGRKMSQPVNANNINGPDDIAYCNVFSQSDVTNWAVAGDFDKGEPARDGIERPDKPILYEITFETSKPDGSIDEDKRIVHYSRLQHIIERPDRSEYLGEGCLEPILHALIDFEKVRGSSAEAHYGNVDRKFIGMGSEEGSLGSDREEVIEQFDEQMREMTDGMRTTAYGENLDIKEISGESVDPSPLLDSLYDTLAGVSQQPQRIMKGSERGELASSQDESNWLSRMSERQEQVAAKRFVIPTIDDYIAYGAVAEPEGGPSGYLVNWRSLFELTDLEKAEMTHTLSQALKNIHDTVAMGADEEAAYRAVGLSPPDADGERGSGRFDRDMAYNIDEDDPEVQAAFDAIQSTNEGQTDD